MTKIHVLILTGVLLALVAGPAFAMHHEVKIAEKEGIGQYFTDSEGRTLYWFEKDAEGQSACTGMCVNNWPIFYRKTIAAPAGVNTDDFNTITREDGENQTTFRGFPLYYFKGDMKPGDTNGHDMMDVWYVINPDDFPSHHH